MSWCTVGDKAQNIAHKTVNTVSTAPEPSGILQYWHQQLMSFKHCTTGTVKTNRQAQNYLWTRLWAYIFKATRLIFLNVNPHLKHLRSPSHSDTEKITKSKEEQSKAELYTENWIKEEKCSDFVKYASSPSTMWKAIPTGLVHSQD